MPPCEYWQQTPRTLLLILKGREKAIERDLELAMFTAWQTARISNYGGDKLKPLRAYMAELKAPQPARRQTPEEMITVLRAISAATSH